MDVSGPIPVHTAPAPKRDDPQRVHDAAQQFESFLIAQMLKTEREAGGSWLGTGDDDAGATAVEMAEQGFAQALGKQGGLGLAHLVEAGVNRANTDTIARQGGSKAHDEVPKPAAR